MEPIGKIYGDKIIEIANDTKNWRFVSKPDLLLDGEGNNCGDRMRFRTRIINDILEIEPEIHDSCIIAKASCNYFLKNLQGKQINKLFSFVEEGVDSYISAFQNEFSLGEDEKRLRKSCIELPWLLAYNLSIEIFNVVSINCELDYNKKSEQSIFDCDTCITTKIIKPASDDQSEKKSTGMNWVHVLKNIFDVNLKDIKSIEKKIRKSCSVKPHRLGKVVISQEEKEALGKLVKSWEPTFLEFFRKEKLDCIVAYNITDVLKQKLPYELESLMQSRKLKYNINLRIFEEIKKKLNKYNIPYSYVKGIALHEYYKENNMMRFFFDIDLLAPDLKSFFDIASILKNEMGFEHYHKLGMACSIKELENSQLHGHAHFIRLVEGKLINVDINFPFLTNDRSKALVGDISYNGEKCTAENLIITLIAHAFKHSILPMKELNDLVLILGKGEINWGILGKLIKLNDMEFKVESIRRTLIRWYGISKNQLKGIDFNTNLSFGERVLLNFIILIGWPFTRVSYRVFQLHNQYKLKKAGTALLENKDSKQYNYFYDFIRGHKKRMYMVPVVSFIRKMDITIIKNIYSNMDCRELFENCFMLKVDGIDLFITDSYIYTFIDNFNVRKELPTEWMAACDKVLSNLYISKEKYNCRFFYDAKNDVWVYN